MSETDLSDRPGWKAVERWLKESERPVTPTPMHEPIAKWGTRGLVVGGAIAFALLTVGFAFEGDPSPKDLLAYAILMGLLAIPCSIAGMLVGFAVWVCRRNRGH